MVVSGIGCRGTGGVGIRFITEDAGGDNDIGCGSITGAAMGHFVNMFLCIGIKGCAMIGVGGVTERGGAICLVETVMSDCCLVGVLARGMI